MTQKVIKVGDSAAVIITKEYLQKLGIHAGDEITVEVNQRTKVFSVRPLTKASERQQRIAELTYGFIDRYRKDLEALAQK